MGSLKANLPVSDGDLGRPRAIDAMANPPAFHPPAAIHIRPGIGRILENTEHARTICLTPHHIVRRRTEEWAHRQWQIVLSQVSHHGPRTVKLAELGEDQAEPRLHLLVGIENDLARAAMRQSGGNGNAWLATRRLLTLALMEALPDLVQLRLSHDAGQSEQQAVMVSAGIVETFAVGNYDAEERAQNRGADASRDCCRQAGRHR